MGGWQSFKGRRYSTSVVWFAGSQWWSATSVCCTDGLYTYCRPRLLNLSWIHTNATPK